MLGVTVVFVTKLQSIIKLTK